MKKTIMLLAALLLAGGSSHAQLLRLGLKAGGNVSNVVGYDAENSGWLIGAHGGVLAQLRPAGLPQWGLQAEALYTMKGDNSATYGPSVMARLDYLDFPVLLQYHWDNIFFEAGPQASYLLSVASVNPLVVLPGTVTFRRWAYGFAAGLGYQDPSGVQIGWRYNADLTNIRKAIQYADDNVQQVRLRNSVMEFYLGYNVGAGQLGGALLGAGKGIGRGTKFLFFTGPKRLLFGKKQRPAPTEAPAATPAPAPAPAPVTPKP
ncbi:PorT family protein [Hymenobacter sp. BT635]|uniref:PorT family protein n=1 Tax=Hymenobacter nitidus TaxID=2880929 RepID=A0ABS8AF64_9BACT|nr:porin family protein [Hymenobacter nitidus]MCB2378901.1 PorT family protein [Hymenobacter nitidus]